MANNNYDDEPRWRSIGPREEPYENENRYRSQERVRNYNRQDMQSYGRRSVNQGNRLRGMRGGRRRGDYESEIGRTSNRGYGNQYQTGPNYTRREGRQSSSFSNEDANLERGDNWLDFDHDIYDTNEGFGQGYDRDRDTSADYIDNYWGGRQQNRVFGDRNDRDWDWIYSRNPQDNDWWNTTGGRPDFFSGRRQDYGRSTEFDVDRQDFESREYDMDPGYAYEFGTDYDFMADTNLNDFGRRGDRDHQERDRRGFGPNLWRRIQGMEQEYNQPGRQITGRGRIQRDWQPEQRQGMQARGNQGTDQGRGWDQHRQSRRPQGRGFMETDQDAGGGEGFVYDWQGQPEDMRFRYVEFWNVPGPFRGVGPNGYQRSDERIKDELNEIFTANGQIDASGIEIDVQNGEVTLSGDVDRRREKYLAEDIAISVMGVRDVNNRIRVMASDGARVRGMGREDVVMPGRIQEGMRVAGVDGKHIGRVKVVHNEGFILDRQQGGDTFIPFRAVKRTNGQIILHVHSDEIDRQGWREEQ